MRRLLAAALSMAGALPAAAFTEADAIAPQLLRVEICRAAGLEIARQADLRRSELDAWHAFRRSLAAELTRGAARLAEEHRRALAVEQRAVTAARSLVPLGGEQAHVPHIGWGIFGYFEQRRADTNQAIAEAGAQVGAGDYGFHVMGQGWTSGAALDAAIAADVQARSDFEAAVSEGTFSISYPGLGWISRSGVENCIATAEEEIARTRATIAAGEYSVSIPGIGWITRNGLESRIAAAQAELAGIEAALAGRTMGIARAGHGWFDGNGLDARIAANEAATAAIDQQLADGALGYPFPVRGWLTGAAIAAEIAEAEAGIAEVRARDAAGQYGVPSAIGWIDATGARAALALPTCRDNGPQPCISAESRPHYQDVLRRIPIAVAADIAIRQLAIDRHRAWGAALASHATPEQERLAADLQMLGVLAAEFDHDLAANRARIQAQIDWLRRSMEFIPGGT